MVNLCGVGCPLSLPRPPAALHDTRVQRELQEENVMVTHEQG